MKYLVIAGIIVALSGCGAADRMAASLTGNGSDSCHDGVVYVQFTSGVSVKYNKSGNVVTCN